METMKQTVSNKRLWCWFAISLAMHAALLLVVALSDEKTTYTKWGSTELTVTLQQQSSKKHKKQRPVKVLRGHSDTRIAKVVHDGTKQTSKTRQNLSSTRHNYLLGQLRTSLSRHLIYPALARKQGWQGIVTVALRIESDGLLKKIQIRQSSGYNVLDDSALNSLRKIKRLQTEEQYADRPHRLTLRVVYQLTDSGYGTSAF
jgi:TonB family protein